MNVRIAAGVFVSIAALAVTACTCTSEGLELKLEGGEEQAVVTFNWQSTDDVTGTMTASFTDGRQFRGPYFSIAMETHVDQLEALWEGWNAGYGWRYWRPGPHFVEEYSGKILASLSDANGDRMRCQFRLANPSSGMSGGGKGNCQLTDGTAVHATLPPARPINGESAAARR